MSRRKRKRVKFEQNRLKKIMRSVQRRKKRREHRGLIRKEIIYSKETSVFLRDKGFYEHTRLDSLMRRSGGRIIIEIPKDFSMAANPDKVISILKKIFYYGMNRDIREITFDHSKCTNLGIAASTIMDTVVLAAKSYRKAQKQFPDLVISGNYPEDEYTKDIYKRCIYRKRFSETFELANQGAEGGVWKVKNVSAGVWQICQRAVGFGGNKVNTVF